MKGQTAYKGKILLVVQLQAWLDQETQTIAQRLGFVGCGGPRPMIPALETLRQEVL